MSSNVRSRQGPGLSEATANDTDYVPPSPFSSGMLKFLYSTLRALLVRWQLWLVPFPSLIGILFYRISALRRSIFSYVLDTEDRWKNRFAIGRALEHSLMIMNSLPSTHSKYQFLRTVSERILAENKDHNPPLLVINRSALKRASGATICDLEATLESDEGLKGLSKLVGRYLGVSSEVTSDRTSRAEKLARELLWLTERLVENGGISEACIQWSKAKKLSVLALHAQPRVQQSLLRLSISLIGSLDSLTIALEDKIAFSLVSNWLPLLCHASYGGEGPILSSLEKQETKWSIEKAVACLPHHNQEIVYTVWLSEFSSSTSDWPDLSESYVKWCAVSRTHILPKKDHIKSV